jgi:hypothetical protein
MSMAISPSAGRVVMTLDGTAVPLDGWDAVEAGVQPGRVVPVDPAEDRPAGFGAGGEPATLDDSRLSDSQNDSATALSQHTPVLPTGGADLVGVAELDVVV